MKNFNKLMIAMAALAASSTLNAASLLADIPFDFTVRGKKLPAGQYRVELNNGLAFARSVETGEAAFKLLPNNVGNILLFTCADGKACEFSDVQTERPAAAKQVAGVRAVTGILVASN